MSLQNKIPELEGLNFDDPVAKMDIERIAEKLQTTRNRLKKIQSEISRLERSKEKEMEREYAIESEIKKLKFEYTEHKCTKCQRTKLGKEFLYLFEDICNKCRVEEIKRS